MAVRAMMYDPSATYVARRKVTIGGRDFDVGTPIPRELAADERTYQKWWGARMLMRAQDAAAVAAQPVPKAMVPADQDRADWAENYSKHVAEKQAEAAPIPHANGHHIPASEKLMDAVAAQASAAPAAEPAPLALTEQQMNEGHIEMAGRGWCTIHFRDKKDKVRGLALASRKLDEFRAEAGLPPLTPAEPASEPPVAQLQPGDQVVDGETGEITTVSGGEDLPELPDDETPSAPWTDGNV